MNTVSVDELKSLAEARTGPCITISLPTHRMGLETRQNPIQFKKLLREAEERLLADGRRVPDVQQMLEPARKLLDDSPFWQHQGDSLAVFLAPDLFRYYRLPITLEPRVVVSSRFHVKPLLSLLRGDGRFYVLALSQNQVRLLEGTQNSIREVELIGMPESLDEALQYEQPEKQVQFRTTAGRSGKGDAMFYGQGAGAEIAKERIVRYFHQVDNGLHKQLKDQRAPLVFAAVDYLFGLYKEVNTYANLLDQAIPGNPEEVSAEELHKRAWAIVQPLFQQNQRQATRYYQQLAGTVRASDKIEEVVPAAHHSRVEMLLVPVDQQLWGKFDTESHAVQLGPQAQPGNEDLLDYAAIHTLLNGGSVYAIPQQQMPDGVSVAAVFRY